MPVKGHVEATKRDLRRNMGWNESLGNGICFKGYTIALELLQLGIKPTSHLAALKLPEYYFCSPSGALNALNREIKGRADRLKSLVGPRKGHGIGMKRALRRNRASMRCKRIRVSFINSEGSVLSCQQSA